MMNKKFICIILLFLTFSCFNNIIVRADSTKSNINGTLVIDDEDIEQSSDINEHNNVVNKNIHGETQLPKTGVKRGNHLFVIGIFIAMIFVVLGKWRYDHE